MPHHRRSSWKRKEADRRLAALIAKRDDRCPKCKSKLDGRKLCVCGWTLPPEKLPGSRKFGV